MHLFDIPIISVMIGLALYAILGGADFGAGLWYLTALPPVGHRWSEQAKRLREHAHHSIGPVWEANHVWLIFVLTVTWTAFPVAFSAIASTLAVPLFIAALGIIFRGAAYAFRSGPLSDYELGAVDTAFSLSSILTPFGLGTAIGAIVAGRVPVGNAAGHLFSSWLNPVSIIVGVLAVAISGYTGAVYLAADAERHGDRWMADQFRTRALIAGVVAGTVAIVGIPVMHSDAHRVFERLIDGIGLVGVAISVAGGVSTMVLVVVRRFGPARISAAFAVGGIIVGWALAQQPVFLPGLTLAQAAAPQDTQIVVIVAIFAGGLILFPSLWLLFRLVLEGRFEDVVPDPGPATGGGAARLIADNEEVDRATSLPRSPAQLLSASARGLSGRAAIALFLAGIGLLNGANAAWAHILGVLAFSACIILGVLAVAPTQMADSSPDAPSSSEL
jgi:cytochrome d ubiquinol oxidase subunit II